MEYVYLMILIVSICFFMTMEVRKRLSRTKALNAINEPVQEPEQEPEQDPCPDPETRTKGSIRFIKYLSLLRLDPLVFNADSKGLIDEALSLGFSVQDVANAITSAIDIEGTVVKLPDLVYGLSVVPFPHTDICDALQKHIQDSLEVFTPTPPVTVNEVERIIREVVAVKLIRCLRLHVGDRSGT